MMNEEFENMEEIEEVSAETTDAGTPSKKKRPRNTAPLKPLAYICFTASIMVALACAMVFLVANHKGYLSITSEESLEETVDAQYTYDWNQAVVDMTEYMLFHMDCTVDSAEEFAELDTNADGAIDEIDITLYISETLNNPEYIQEASEFLEEYGQGAYTISLLLNGEGAVEKTSGTFSETASTYTVESSEQAQLALSKKFTFDSYGDMLAAEEEYVDEGFATFYDFAITATVYSVEDYPYGVTLEDGITYEYIADEDCFYPVEEGAYSFVLANYDYIYVDALIATQLLEASDALASQVASNYLEAYAYLELKDSLLSLLVISGILTLIFFIMSTVLCGAKGRPRLVEKIWLEATVVAGIVLANLFVIVYGNGYLDFRYMDIITSISQGDVNSSILMCLWTMAVSALICLGLLLCLNNIIARIKCKTFFKHSLICMILRGFKKVIISGGCTLRDFGKYIANKVPFVAGAIFIYIIVVIMDFAVFCAMLDAWNLDIAYAIFWIWKLIFSIASIIFICMMHELFKGADKLAKGDTTHRINTKFMLPWFKRHGENLNHINEGVEHAVAERMKSERMKSELITNVSHDIKTPLTSIINYVDLLEKESIKEQPAAEYIEVISRQADRLKKLVVDLVDASKASTGNVSVELAQMNINLLVEQLSAEYVDKLSAKDITLVTNLDHDHGMVMADGRHLWRVMDNLFNNACKYTMPNTRLYIDSFLVDDGKSIAVEFKNISEKPLNITPEELMERFVRGDESRNTEGSGLGLSIAKSLTELQNGTFDIAVDGDLFKARVVFGVVEGANMESYQTD